MPTFKGIWMFKLLSTLLSNSLNELFAESLDAFKCVNVNVDWVREKKNVFRSSTPILEINKKIITPRQHACNGSSFTSTH